MFSEIIGILLATTMTVGFFYPEILINILLSTVKDKKTGAFDLIVQGVKVAKSICWNLSIDSIYWKNPPLCFPSPYFVRMTGLVMDIDIRSAFHAVLINRSSNVVVVPSIEIDSMDVYIVQAEDGESGATLNLWACLGSQNDEEATTMLSTIQQSINRVIGQSPTTTTTKSDVSSSPSSVTEEGKEENQRIPYKIHLSRFSLRQLTLHAPAFMGPTAPPMVITDMELLDLSSTAGASMDDVVYTIVGEIIQRIVAKYPMLTMRYVIRGAMSLGRGFRDTGLALESNMQELVSAGLGESMTAVIDDVLDPPIVNIDGAGLAQTMLDPTMDYLNNIVPGFSYVSYPIDGLLSGLSTVNHEVVTTASMFRITTPKLNPNSQPSKPVLLFESTR